MSQAHSNMAPGTRTAAAHVAVTTVEEDAERLEPSSAAAGALNGAAALDNGGRSGATARGDGVFVIVVSEALLTYFSY